MQKYLPPPPPPPPPDFYFLAYVLNLYLFITSIKICSAIAFNWMAQDFTDHMQYAITRSEAGPVPNNVAFIKSRPWWMHGQY